MTTEHEVPRVVSASCELAAGPERIFELIADPAQQPCWDGNGNLAEAAAGRRVRRVGDMFTMTLTGGAVRCPGLPAAVGDRSMLDVLNDDRAL
jgi:uncharacterized protein YndB with AHSA1/START domain